MRTRDRKWDPNLLKKDGGSQKPALSTQTALEVTEAQRLEHVKAVHQESYERAQHFADSLATTKRKHMP